MRLEIDCTNYVCLAYYNVCYHYSHVYPHEIVICDPGTLYHQKIIILLTIANRNNILNIDGSIKVEIADH